MAIDAAKVKELRERTGLPMMECKKALEEAGGDIEKSIEELRKRGAKAQEKLAGREARKGRIGNYVSDDGRIGALVTLRCETEPVANNDQFQVFVKQLVDIVVEERPADAESFKKCALPSGGTVADGLTELINQLRENMFLGPFARFEADAIGQYVHFDDKKAGMVALKGNSLSDEKVATVGKELGMHIVFSKPRALSRDDLDPEYLAKEKEIRLAAAKNDPKNAKKPPEILEKILEGQMNKLAKEICLLEQPFVKDDKVSVEKHLKAIGAGVTIEKFIYAATDA